MRLIDADAFAIKLKEISRRQGYENTYTRVADVIDAIINDLNGTSFSGFEVAPTVRAYSEESIKVFRSKLEKWLFNNSESVCGSNMIDIDYLSGKIEELFDELNMSYDSKNVETPKIEARIITYASWIHSEETSDFKEHWTCSNCNHDIIENPIFKNKITGEPLNFEWCPYCGSKMIKEDAENES